MKNEDVVRSIKIIYEIFWKFVFFVCFVKKLDIS